MTTLSKPAYTIMGWGIYLVIAGLFLLLVPNVLIGLFGYEPTHEIWIRLLGVVTSALGYYHIQAARSGFQPFFVWSAQGRIYTFISVTTFVGLGLTKSIMLVIAISDLLGALSTIWAFRASHAESLPPSRHSPA